MASEILVPVALGALLIPAVVSDCRQRRIPNALPVAGSAVGLVMHSTLSGWPGLAASVSGFLLLLMLTFPLFLLHWWGAGDVKLVAAVGSLVGLDAALPTLFAVVVSGGLLGLLALARRRLIGRTLRRLGASAAVSVASRHLVHIGPSESEQRVTMPYAVSIALGTAAAWVFFRWL